VEKNRTEFLEAIDRLRDFVAIVEGRKDRSALKTLGIYNVIAINGRPLIEVVHEAKDLGGVPVILTDFDRKGREIAGRLNALFQAYKIHPNQQLRCRIMEFGKNRIEDFRLTGAERPGLDLIKESDSHGKAGAHFNKVYYKGPHKGKRGSGKAGRHWGYFWPD